MPDIDGTSQPRASLADRMRVEQIDTLYRRAMPGVLGAFAGAIILLGTLVALRSLTLSLAVAWGLGIAFCVAVHIYLSVRFDRARRQGGPRQPWATAFVVASMLDGAWWGASTVLLASPDDLVEQLMVISVAFVVVAASTSAFSYYLPSFLGIFYLTTFPALSWHAYLGGPVHWGLASLILVLIVVMTKLGRFANDSFVETLRLRFEKDDLVDDLRLQNNRAEQAIRDKSYFLAAASHDLRQPVHALGMFAGALSRHEMPKEMRTLVTHIEGSIQAMDGLFSSLLDISRLDAGIVQPQLQVFQIARLLDRLRHEYRVEAAQKGLDLRCCTSSVFVKSDPALLERILRNLVTNAVRHTDRGRILLGCRRGARHLVVQVWDTGPGIAASERERIFAEYYQAANPERERSKGLGLGLAIVKRLTILLDVRLRLRSVVGKGTVFEVLVPIAAPPLYETPHVRAEVGPADIRGCFVLLVDDDRSILEATRSLLTSWGASVIAAESCEDLLSLVADCADRPDLLICDYRLREGMSGIDAIRRIQDEYNDVVPAVLITGDTAVDRLLLAQESGLVVLHKPVANSKLRATIGNLLKTVR